MANLSYRTREMLRKAVCYLLEIRDALTAESAGSTTLTSATASGAGSVAAGALAVSLTVDPSGGSVTINGQSRPAGYFLNIDVAPRTLPEITYDASGGTLHIEEVRAA